MIVRTDRVGDVVLTTPVISALRENYSEARLSIMVAPETKEIVEGNPYLDAVIVFDRKKAHKNFGRLLKFILSLREKKFDCAIILHTKKITNLICFLAGIPRRAGYRNEKFGFLLTDGIKDTRAEGTKHEAEYSLDVLRHLGLSFPNATKTFGGDNLGISSKIFLPIKAEAERWVEEFLRENKLTGSDHLIAVHPDASCISKRWPPKNFAELINKIQKKYPVKILMIGTEASRGIVSEIISLVQDVSSCHSEEHSDEESQREEILRFAQNDIIDLSGKTSISQLISLLKRCQLLISNDSGPVHLASGVGIPVISIFGRNQAGLSPVRWSPLSEKSVVFHKDVGCQICLAHNCDINFKCLEAVHPQEVFEAFDSLLRPC